MTATSSPSGPKTIGEILSEPAQSMTRIAECETHGPYESRGYQIMHITGWSRCPKCAAEKKAREELAEAHDRAERERQRHERMIQSTAVPRRFIGIAFDGFVAETPEKQRVLAVCRAYSESFDRHAERGTGMVFSGPPGVGKSHLAACILQALLPRHVGAYVTFRDMIRTFRDTWGRTGTSEREVLAHFGGLPLLVIDEIGTGYGTDAERAHLFDVIDMRYRDRKPCILLTNLDAKGLEDVMGERTFDRIVETMKWLAFSWASFRPQAKRMDRA